MTTEEQLNDLQERVAKLEKQVVSTMSVAMRMAWLFQTPLEAFAEVEAAKRRAAYAATATAGDDGAPAN